MAAREFYDGKAELIKARKERFSSGECTAKVAVKEVINSRGVKTVDVQAKLHTDERSLVLKTRDSFAGELQTGDSVKFKGYTYLVQAVRSLNCAGSVAEVEYEVTLK